jgi:hypothetical protein
VTIDECACALGLVLPEPFCSPTDMAYPFAWVRIQGKRASIPGRLPPQADGTLAEPCGKLERLSQLSRGVARLVGLTMMLGSLQRELGELERTTARLHVLVLDELEL